jgi:VanZ family protein
MIFSKKRDYNLKDLLKLLPGISIAIIIFYFSSLSNPYPTPPTDITNLVDLNALLHIAEFTLFSFSITYGLFNYLPGLSIIIIGTSYAILDEIHQFFVPGRHFDVFDIILDSIGILVGFFLFYIMKKLIKKYKINSFVDKKH